MALDLSLAVIAKNEARCLARCLTSVQKLVDEIVLVDTGSTDETVATARQFNARVSQFTWTNDFSAARNFALEQTAGAWILVLDADEHASPELVLEVRKFIQQEPAVGRLKIVSEFRRQGQLLRSQTFVSRLFPRGARFEGRIHEQLLSPLPRLNLAGELWHDGYLQPAKSERNLRLLKEELAKSPDDAYLLYQLALEYTSLGDTPQACGCLERAYRLAQPSEPFAPNVAVDYLYALAELKQFDTALSVIARSETALDDFPDYHLACGLFYMNLIRSDSARYVGYLPRIESSFKRALAQGETDRYKSVRGAGTFLAQYNLGTLYHVFDEKDRARECFEQAAKQGYRPAVEMLQRLGNNPA